MSNMALTQESYQETPTKANRKAQLSHLLLDVDFFDKPKIQALTVKFGNTGCLFLIRLYAAMSRATGGIIDLDTVRFLARSLEFEAWEEFITYCVTRHIIQKDHVTGMLINTRVAEDQEKLAKRREDTNKRTQLWREKKDSDALVTRHSVSVTDTDTVSVLDSSSLVLSSSLPDEFNKPPIKAALDLWGQYLAEKHKRRFDHMARDALLAGYRGSAENLEPDIMAAIAGGWKNIHPGAGKSNGTGNGTGPPTCPVRYTASEQAQMRKDADFFESLRILGEARNAKG